MGGLLARLRALSEWARQARLPEKTINNNTVFCMNLRIYRLCERSREHVILILKTVDGKVDSDQVYYQTKQKENILF